MTDAPLAVLLARFWPKVKIDANGCWNWTASTNLVYGKFWLGDRLEGAHVFSCTLAHGPRPGPEYDCAHACHNPLCVRPDHLSWQTRRENLLDSTSPIMAQLQRTKCPKGHALTGSNLYLYVTKKGSRKRDCRKCRNVRRRGAA
jgi:hypothetical protein